MENDYKDFSGMGDEIKKIVQNAVESQNFKELSSQIQDTVNTALDSASDIVKTVGTQSVRSLFGNASLVKNPERKRQHAARDENAIVPSNSRLFVSRFPGSVSRQLQRIAGGVFSVVFGVGILINGVSLLNGIVGGNASLLQTLFGTHTINFWLSLVFFAVSLTFFIRGSSRSNLIKRYGQYIKALQGKPFATLSELADRTGLTLQKVQNDISIMLHNRMFLQGHLTDQQDCLIVTDATYEQYRLVQDQQAKRQAEANAFIRSAPDAATARECARIIEEGTQWLNHIRHVNDALPEKEISDKLDKLEKGVNRIFEEVKKQPRKASELHKFMNYYLPTTAKLIDAYAELDKQENTDDSVHVANTKKQIAESLDTINAAFDKLFDKLFAARALDISTDITVLETMLAQEGLTKGDFE